MLLAPLSHVPVGVNTCAVPAVPHERMEIPKLSAHDVMERKLKM